MTSLNNQKWVIKTFLYSLKLVILAELIQIINIKFLYSDNLLIILHNITLSIFLPDIHRVDIKTCNYRENIDFLLLKSSLKTIKFNELNFDCLEKNLKLLPFIE